MPISFQIKANHKCYYLNNVKFTCSICIQLVFNTRGPLALEHSPDGWDDEQDIGDLLSEATKF